MMVNISIIKLCFKPNWILSKKHKAFTGTSNIRRMQETNPEFKVL